VSRGVGGVVGVVGGGVRGAGGPVGEGEVGQDGRGGAKAVPLCGGRGLRAGGGEGDGVRGARQ